MRRAAVLLALIGLALRYLSGHSPTRRYIADASYWVYIIHLPIVLALQVALSQSNLHWAVTFPAILGGSLLLCFLSYHWLVRRSFVGVLLNGRRYRRAAPRRRRSGTSAGAPTAGSRVTTRGQS